MDTTDKELINLLYEINNEYCIIGEHKERLDAALKPHIKPHMKSIEAVKEKALKEIQMIVNTIKVDLKRAQTIADEHKLTFRFDPSYGMGGTYRPNEGWVSSSQNC